MQAIMEYQFWLLPDERKAKYLQRVAELNDGVVPHHAP
jgi:hypothetical protein